MRLPEYLSRNVAVIFAISFFVNLGFSCISPVFPYYILALKGVLVEIPEQIAGPIEAYKASLELGTLMAAFMISRAPTAVFVGYLSDLVGRKRIIVLGLALYLLTAVGFIFSPDIPFLILARALQGFSSAMVWPVAEALLTELVGKAGRGKAMSIYISLMNFAGILGPSIGVAVYKIYIGLASSPDLLTALRTPFIFLAAVSLIALLLSLSLPKGGGGRSPSSGKPISSLDGVRSAFEGLVKEARQSIYVICLNGVVNGFGMGIMNTSAIVYVIQEVVKDPAGLGLLYSVGGLAIVISSILAGHASDRIGRRKGLVLVGYVLSRPLLFLIPFVRDLWALTFLYVVISLSFGIGMPLMRVLQAELTPSRIRGTIFGLQQTFFNSGAAVGSLIGGYLCAVLSTRSFNLLGFEVSGITIPFWITASLGVLTTILFWIYVHDPSEIQPHQPKP